LQDVRRGFEGDRTGFAHFSDDVHRHRLRCLDVHRHTRRHDELLEAALDLSRHTGRMFASGDHFPDEG